MPKYFLACSTNLMRRFHIRFGSDIAFRRSSSGTCLFFFFFFISFWKERLFQSTKRVELVFSSENLSVHVLLLKKNVIYGTHDTSRESLWYFKMVSCPYRPSGWRTGNEDETGVQTLMSTQMSTRHGRPKRTFSSGMWSHADKNNLMQEIQVPTRFCNISMKEN